MNTISESSDLIELARKKSLNLKPSRKWFPMIKQEEYQCPLADRNGNSVHVMETVEVWTNQYYTATCRKYPEGWEFGGGAWARIGIYCENGQPLHDFRDMQRIKNDLVGAEWEGIELFPSESRLVDPSNYYILYCAPSIPIGIARRNILNVHNCLAPQRPWHPSDVPADAKGWK